MKKEGMMRNEKYTETLRKASTLIATTSVAIASDAILIVINGTLGTLGGILPLGGSELTQLGALVIAGVSFVEIWFGVRSIRK